MNHSNRPAHGPSAADQTPDSVPNTTAGLAASGPSVRQPSTEHSRSDNSPTELELLLEALCEERLTPELVQRLEQLVLTSPESRWQYLTYLDLHGTLFWDAAGAGSPEPLSSHEIPVYVAPAEVDHRTKPMRSNRRKSVMIGFVSICLLLGSVSIWRSSTRMTNVTAPSGRISQELEATNRTKSTHTSASREYGPPITLPNVVASEVESQTSRVTTDRHAVSDTPPVIPPKTNEEVVALIDEHIGSRWTEYSVGPSAKADDSEWLRRITLDVLGRVPTVAEAEAFLSDRRDQKRQMLVESLLSDSTFVRNLTTKWTNLLIGRASNSQVNREAFQKFLRLSFAENRPWNQIVSELISAEGNNSERGATNFLIAHLNNDAAPATAVVSRLFLGRQVHCNQCHNNPFDDTKQVAFWELNSFFQQTTGVFRNRRDPDTGRLLASFTELVTRDAGGPTYFESQTGLMRVAYPRFNDQEIDPSPETNRRQELARLMTSGDQPQLAAAFVNRMWEHFFGIGFTRDVDDLGPHQPASHPELLAALSEQFIRSGYDIKQLVRWICQSQPYQLSSRFSESNQSDDPSRGDVPVFSRMYVKSMTAEQTYDSFLTATKAHQVGAVDWTHAEQNRQQWLQQFVVSFNTDDNDEAMAFEGSIGNALSLMNGPLIEKALDVSTGSFLGEVIRQKSSESEKIRSLSLAALSRPPSPSEFTTMKKLLRDSPSSQNGRGKPVEAYQDLFWALLNSNEFALVH